MKNKQARNLMLNVATQILTVRDVLDVYPHKLTLGYCESGKLSVFNHYEEPWPVLEGYVGEGRFKLGVISKWGKGASISFDGNRVPLGIYWTEEDKQSLTSSIIESVHRAIK